MNTMGDYILDNPDVVFSVLWLLAVLLMVIGYVLIRERGKP